MISIRIHTYFVQKSHCLTESVKISTIVQDILIIEHVTMILIPEWVQKRNLIMQKPTTGLINGVAEQIIKHS